MPCIPEDGFVGLAVSWRPGIGGAMGLCHGVLRILAASQHIDKRGDSKIKQRAAPRQVAGLYRGQRQ